MTKLSELQSEVLRAFFERERGFYLTGGAALAGFHLKHRATADLDLFTHDEQAFERGRFVLEEGARALGASLTQRQRAPRFSRFVITRADQAVVVDLVCDETADVRPKLTIEGVVVDSPEEILANKLTTILSRSEERDLVDLLFLERAGLRVEDALADALRKDASCTPATLAWLLSQVEIPDGARLPAGVSPAELRAFVTDLETRLAALASPRK